MINCCFYILNPLGMIIKHTMSMARPKEPRLLLSLSRLVVNHCNLSSRALRCTNLSLTYVTGSALRELSTHQQNDPRYRQLIRVGAVSLTAFPQLPQFLASLLKLTQLPKQAVSGKPHDVSQVPPMHLEPGPH
jgi:hypothetical protein